MLTDGVTIWIKKKQMAVKIGSLMALGCAVKLYATSLNSFQKGTNAAQVWYSLHF